MSKFNSDWQKKSLIKALTAVIEHDEYLIEMNVSKPFIELERARALISKIERCDEVESRIIAQPTS